MPSASKWTRCAVILTVCPLLHHSLRHPVQLKGAPEEQHQQKLRRRLPGPGAEAGAEAVPRQKGARRLR